MKFSELPEAVRALWAKSGGPQGQWPVVAAGQKFSKTNTSYSDHVVAVAGVFPPYLSATGAVLGCPLLSERP